MVVVNVPTINQRKRIPQKAIDQVVEQIVENFKPQKIILFGSYARGNIASRSPKPQPFLVMNWRLPFPTIR